jgi:hypothetical protein
LSPQINVSFPLQQILSFIHSDRVYSTLTRIFILTSSCQVFYVCFFLRNLGHY